MPDMESYQFQAETRKLLNIIIHSIYTNKEIFLRELISNASDALDKIRFEINRGTEVHDSDAPLNISITPDKDNRVLTVQDTGVGMNREEIISNLGTIAKSGTEEFLKQVSEQNQNPDNIIGQFGVGFYSVFMVAEKVDITSRSFRADDSPVFWSSDGLGDFAVSETGDDAPRGTRIDIHLKEECTEFLEPDRLKSIVKKHSNFISFPIMVESEKVNTIPALWKESKFNITEDQYNEFYKFLSYDPNPPFKTIHISVDAPVQFNSLLFIPQKDSTPFESYLNSEYGLGLYINRVLIQRKNKELIPQYLGFIQGVVDTEDLPLNLSRETIQESALIRKINATIGKQVLKELEKMASTDPESYKTFWQEHGRVFKLGYTDFSNQETFSKLLRFNSSADDDASGLTSLEEYVQRMKSEQQSIYFVSGPSRENIAGNPHLEIFAAKGLEVLYLFEPIDEFVLQALGTYQDKPIKSVEHVDPNELDKVATEEETSPDLSQEEEKSLNDLLQKMKDILGDRVTEVRQSKRLKTSPACLVNPQDGMTSQMQKILHTMNKDQAIPAQILEINPKHPLSQNLLKVYNNNPDDPFINESTQQLFETALLMAGYLADPHDLVNRTFGLLENASSWYTQVHSL